MCIGGVGAGGLYYVQDRAASDGGKRRQTVESRGGCECPHDGSIWSISWGGLSQRREQNLRNRWAGRRSVLPLNAGL